MFRSIVHSILSKHNIYRTFPRNLHIFYTYMNLYQSTNLFKNYTRSLGSPVAKLIIKFNNKICSYLQPDHFPSSYTHRTTNNPHSPVPVPSPPPPPRPDTPSVPNPHHSTHVAPLAGTRLMSPTCSRPNLLTSNRVTCVGKVAEVPASIEGVSIPTPTMPRSAASSLAASAPIPEEKRRVGDGEKGMWERR